MALYLALPPLSYHPLPTSLSYSLSSCYEGYISMNVLFCFVHSGLPECPVCLMSSVLSRNVCWMTEGRSRIWDRLGGVRFWQVYLSGNKICLLISELHSQDHHFPPLNKGASAHPALYLWTNIACSSRCERSSPHCQLRFCRVPSAQNNFRMLSHKDKRIQRPL